MLPRDGSDVFRLFQQQRIDPESERGRRLWALWVTGALIFYQEWDGNWSGRETMATTGFLADQFRVALDRGVRDANATGAAYQKRRAGLDTLDRQGLGVINETHTIPALMIFGPLYYLNAPANALYTTSLAREEAYFSALVEELRGGRLNALGRRLAMYVNAGWATFWGLLGIRATGDGYTMEENILAPAEHCEGEGSCVEETAKGKVPIGTLLPIGTRKCLTNCKCRIEYS
jgi:hypothetical protein